MKRSSKLFEQGGHSWTMIARDPNRPADLIDTNEYLIADGDAVLVTDPGGTEIFPSVFSAAASALDPSRIQNVFASHQDPDVISSLALWLEFNPAIRCYVSWLWTTFLPHFGGEKKTFIPLADDGGRVVVGGAELTAVPAHFLHSAGNLHLYDPIARILFTGDVGAALLPADAPEIVADFDAHIRHAAGFHRRWMGSNEAKMAWCERVSKMKIDMLCPQHGSVYRGRDVERFVNWFAELRVAVTKTSEPQESDGGLR